MQDNRKYKITYIVVSIFFGFGSVMRKLIDFGAGMVALHRSFIGAVTIVVLLLIKKKKINWKGIKENWKTLVLCSIFISFNWIFLFSAYSIASVPICILFYNMAPFLVILTSPFIDKKRMSKRSVAATAVALVGIVIVSGILGGDALTPSDWLGGLLAFIAAIFYASMMTLNRFYKGDLDGEDKTLVQLFLSGIIMTPYVIFFEGIEVSHFDMASVIWMAVFGIVVTGLAYVFYLNSLPHLSGQSIGIICLLEPISGIFLSAPFLHETLGLNGIIGAALILGAAVLGQAE